MTADTPATRRQVLAFLALADAPTPRSITFRDVEGGTLSLDVDSLAAAAAWREAFGDCGWWGSHPQLMTPDGQEPYFADQCYGEWRDWHIRMHTREPAPSAGAELDADTREQLAEVADEETPEADR